MVQGTEFDVGSQLFVGFEFVVMIVLDGLVDKIGKFDLCHVFPHYR